MSTKVQLAIKARYEGIMESKKIANSMLNAALIACYKEARFEYEKINLGLGLDFQRLDRPVFKTEHDALCDWIKQLERTAA